MSSRSSAALSLVGFALILACAVGGTVARVTYNDHVATCTVTEKDRGGSRDGGSSHYRVYTEQCGVLVNEDQWLVGKTNSADVWSQIQPHHTYRLRVVGGRFSLLSMFPNIVEVQGEVGNG